MVWRQLHAVFSYSYLIGYLVASWSTNLIVCQAQFLGLCLAALSRKDSMLLAHKLEQPCFELFGHSVVSLDLAMH